MSVNDKLKLFDNWKERLSAYGMALALIGVDQVFGSPSEGAAYMSEKAAVLRGEQVKVLHDEEIFGMITELLGMPEGSFEEYLKDSPLDEGDLRRELELYLDMLKKERNVPPEMYVEFSRILDESKRMWLRYKEEEDYRSYAPYLKRVIDGYKGITALADSTLDLYDRMLDDNQPGWTKERYDVFFDHIRERVVPLVRECSKRPAPGMSFLENTYDPDGQRRVMKKVTDFIGFTLSWGRIGESEHPLTSAISKGDVRFTTKFRLHDPSQAILSTVHESGHAWFGHNVDRKYDGSVIAHTISAGLHESQSRLCENHMGRSRAFWDKVFPWLKEEFSDELKGVSAEDFYNAISYPKPSLVRTESDELTYPLHILIRYELEKEFIGGSLEAADLEGAWNDKYSEYLGIRPDRPSKGILQDMHWPYAYFGYFPTYALGSAMAAQFYDAMTRDIDPMELIIEDRYTDIMKWLEEHVHRYANRYEADEVLRRATGENFNDEYYFKWLEGKYDI